MPHLSKSPLRASASRSLWEERADYPAHHQACGKQSKHQPACSPHVLRHTFSVTAVLKGISLPSLQRLLGHDRLTTTEIYLNLSPEEAIKGFQSKW
jgi:site-specific recombinase XerD